MNKKLVVLSLIIFVLYGFNLPCYAEEDYFTVVSEKDEEVIFTTSMGVSMGDYYINGKNKKYKIIKTKGNKAIAKFEETVNLQKNDDNLFALSQGILAGKGKKLIALYNTHSDESYKPTSGTHSEPGKGDVYSIGDVLTNALEKKGIEVEHNKSKHDPHDGGAYERSRRTATRLMRKRPDALIDIHRDGVPNGNQYVANVGGNKVAQIRLVVGRQSPQMKANDQFARQIKAVADKYYPGLVKGIFYAKGKYNQDLSTRATLIEFGTHVLPQELANTSAGMIADSLNKLLYGGVAGAKQGIKKEQSASGFSSVGIILLVLLIGGGAYFLIHRAKRGDKS